MSKNELSFIAFLSFLFFIFSAIPVHAPPIPAGVYETSNIIIIMWIEKTLRWIIINLSAKEILNDITAAVIIYIIPAFIGFILLKNKKRFFGEAKIKAKKQKEKVLRFQRKITTETRSTFSTIYHRTIDDITIVYQNKP